MTGKKERPLTEPMYSGGNLLDFPITSGFDLISYYEFLGSFIKKLPKNSLFSEYA